MRGDKPNVIVEKCIEFSLAIIRYAEVLEQDREFVIAQQLLRAGTSIGANVYEAQNAESLSDFIHKMKIAAKEASESKYWLTLCERSDCKNFDTQLIICLNEIILILSKIISTSKLKRRS